MINLHSVIESLSINFFVSTLSNENNLCTENCEAEREILNHSKEGAIDMLNALTEAFSNVEIEVPAEQKNPFTTSATAVPEIANDIQQKNRRGLFRFGRNRRAQTQKGIMCPKCPKSGGSEACPKCSPRNFCFLTEHGNSSDDAMSKDMCPKCSPHNFCRDTGHGNSEESPAHKSSCVKCSPEYFGCMEDPKAFRNPGNTKPG